MKLCSKEGTPAQASAAVFALAALADSSPSSSRCSSPAVRSAAVDALRQVSSARSLNLSNPRAAANVSALAAFSRCFPKEFARHESKAWAFAAARVNGGAGGGGGDGGDGSDEDDDVGDGGGGRGKKNAKGKKRSRAGEISPACQTLCASMELLCNCLLASPSSAATATGRKEEELLKDVFVLLEAGGQPAGEEAMSGQEGAEIRLAGARCVARLCMLSGRVRVSSVCRCQGCVGRQCAWNRTGLFFFHLSSLYIYLAVQTMCKYKKKKKELNVLKSGC